MLRAKCLPVDSAIMQREQKIFVLYGLGGIGKTQICLKFAQDHRNRYEYTHTFTFHVAFFVITHATFEHVNRPDLADADLV